jgi:hypothetical protein
MEKRMTTSVQYRVEVIAPEIRQLLKEVHFHTKSLKAWCSGTKRCLVGAPVVQVVSGVAMRPWSMVKLFLQKSPR